VAQKHDGKNWASATEIQINKSSKPATKIGRGIDRSMVYGQTFLTSSSSDRSDLAKCRKEDYKTILIY
jgi:hypothetical protein